MAPIPTGSEEHVDWLETQPYRIEKVELQDYLSEQMGGHDGRPPASRYCCSTS